MLGQVLWVGAGLLALVLIQALCSYYSDYQATTWGPRSSGTCGKRCSATASGVLLLLRQPHRGDLSAPASTNDSLALAEFFHHVPEDILVNSIKLLGACLILWNIHWRMTLVILAFLPLCWPTPSISTRRWPPPCGRAGRIWGRSTPRREDTLSAIRMVQSFCNEEIEAAKFHRLNEKFLKSRRASYRGEALCWGGMDAFASLIPIAVVVFGGLSILQGSLALSELVVFLLYVATSPSPSKAW